MIRVLITGANGFVGQHLGPYLQAQGYQVRAAVRHRDAVLPKDIEKIEIGDIGPDTDWTEALQGVDAIVHLAARVHVMKDSHPDPFSEFLRVNLGGTKKLAEEAAKHGKIRLIFISSIKAQADSSSDNALTEKDPCVPKSLYGLSKWEAEKALKEIQLETVILRPPLIYGPGVKGNFKTLLTLCQKRLPFPFSSVRNQRSLLYIGNLTHAIALCLKSPKAVGKIWNLQDDAPVSTSDMIRILSSALGKSPRLFPFPVFALKFCAILAGKRTVLDRLTGSMAVDDRAIRTDLGWKPPYTMQEGFQQTVQDEE